MPRYIDADALKAKYEQMIPEIGDGYHKETLQDCLFELKYAPTVSLDEVRGVGKWIHKPHIHGVVYCSECDYELRVDDTNYCPNCGAKMEVTDDA